MEYCRIAPDVVLGKYTRIHAFVNLYGCSIGDNTRVGAFVEIQKGVRIGRNCKISSHTFICEGVSIADGVFVGHNVTFINDKYPRAIKSDGSMMNDHDWKVIPTRIGKNVSIGSSVTIMCGVIIGEGAIIGAGSVVTRDIPSDEIWTGNPARLVRNI